MQEQDWGLDPEAILSRAFDILERIELLLNRVDEGWLDIQDETWV